MMAGSDMDVQQNGSPGEEDSKTNLIINYLPQNMTQDELRSLFGCIGELHSCKLVRDKVSGLSLGYAFVNFFKPQDAEKAITTLNGLKLQNKTIKVSFARPSSDAIKGANLYVSGLPKNMSQQEFESIFASCGRIITSHILSDYINDSAMMKVSGNNKGVGFVRFDQRAEAERAIQELNGTVLKGTAEPITVKFANHPGTKNQFVPPSVPFMTGGGHRFPGPAPLAGRFNSVSRLKQKPVWFREQFKTGWNSPYASTARDGFRPGWNKAIANGGEGMVPEQEDEMASYQGAYDEQHYYPSHDQYRSCYNIGRHGPSHLVHGNHHPSRSYHMGQPSHLIHAEPYSGHPTSSSYS